jgi:AcrR family transcriptional regulator
MDKRQQRSQARLFEAVLALANEFNAGDITMSQIAERASVHRSTVYEHASSPADLLQAALRSELDVIRDRYLNNVPAQDAAAAVMATTEAVLLHVDHHAVIYTRGLGAGSESASLHAMLSSHFQATTRQLLAQNSLEIPFTVPGVEESVIGDSVAHYIANGTVGAIEVWLSTPAPRDPAAFTALFAHLLPSWWPSSGNDSAPERLHF